MGDNLACSPSECGMLSHLYTHSPASKAPLRIGALVDAPELIRPFAAVLRDIARSDFASLELVIYNADERHARPVKRRLAGRLRTALLDSKMRAALLWNVYSRLDQLIFHVDNDPLGMEDCGSMLDGVESLHVRPIRNGYVNRFPEETLKAIRSKDLDVLLGFGFNIIGDGVLKTAKYGVWSFYYADNDYYRGDPAYFWELYEQNPLSGASLHILTEEPGAGRVLAKALFPTEFGVSVIRNHVQPYWSSSHLVIQKLWELHAYGWEFVERRILSPAPYRGKRKIYHVPTNAEIVRWLVPQVAKKLCQRAKRIVARSGDTLHWQIGIRTGSHYIQGANKEANTAGFRWIESPKGHFYADPFVVERDGQHFVFFEDYDYRQKLGAIACAMVSPSGQMGEHRPVLVDNVHLSYPYIFAEGDSIYMIPESGAAGVVRLYRCTRFPEQWSPVTELFFGPAFDTSVWKQDGMWWFFTTLVDPRGYGNALYLFFSESLTGKWLYHPSNPISHDVRNARGAGRLFRKGDQLIRPSQNSIIRYGYGFALNEIVKLTPAEYQERTILSVEPNWCRGLKATHTYNQDGSIEVIDGQTLRRRSEL
jgi:hypothetical protein